jgi:hypothetical protein
MKLSPLMQRALTVFAGLVVMGVAMKVPAAMFASIGVPDGKTLLGMAGFGLVTWAMKHFADAKERRIAVAEARISGKMEAADARTADRAALVPPSSQPPPAA